MYPMRRWVAFSIVFSLFVLRAYLMQGYVFLAYALSIYYLTRTVMFLTPASDEDGTLSSLPDHREDSEHKGFQRTLPEMQYWSRMMLATIVVSALSCFECMNLKVVWQVLVFYFLIASVMLCNRQYKHARKHGYNPLQLGKKKSYASQKTFAKSHS